MDEGTSISDEWKGAARMIALYAMVPRVDLRDQPVEDSEILLTLTKIDEPGGYKPNYVGSLTFVLRWT
jgi:hypothetical protein